MRYYTLMNTFENKITIESKKEPELALLALLANCGNYKSKAKLIKKTDLPEYKRILYEFQVGKSYYSLMEEI